MMKNTFYFFFKALFVLNIFEFLSRLDRVGKNGFNRKIRLVSNIMMSQRS